MAAPQRAAAAISVTYTWGSLGGGGGRRHGSVGLWRAQGEGGRWGLGGWGGWGGATFAVWGNGLTRLGR
ncbi:hypothetical protein GCM10009730_18810 [Streptomyces albidochromogenes]